MHLRLVMAAASLHTRGVFSAASFRERDLVFHIFV